jgi:NIPSNAP
VPASFALKTSPHPPAITAAQETEKTMIYEMRVYRCLPGRLPVLLKRFENTTLRLWDKHGIRPAGFFTTLIGESNQELTYLLAWESLAEREKKWTAFQADPDWISARASSEADGQIIGNIVSQLLVPTAFSSVK